MLRSKKAKFSPSSREVEADELIAAGGAAVPATAAARVLPAGSAAQEVAHASQRAAHCWVVGLLGILLFAGCVALVGGAVNEVDKAITEEQANDEPTVVAEGKPFTHDGYEVAAGWSVDKEKFGGATIEGLRVTNTVDEQRSALLTFRFYKGNENLGEVECSSNQMQADEVSNLDCFSFDDGFPQGYDAIKVADAF